MQKAAAGALSPSVAVPSLVRPLGEGRAGATETVIEAEAGPLGPRVSFLFQRDEKSNGEWKVLTTSMSTSTSTSTSSKTQQKNSQPLLLPLRDELPSLPDQSSTDRKKRKKNSTSTSSSFFSLFSLFLSPHSAGSKKQSGSITALLFFIFIRKNSQQVGEFKKCKHLL